MLGIYIVKVRYMISYRFIVKGTVAYLNYGHMYACDNYYTKCI